MVIFPLPFINHTIYIYYINYYYDEQITRISASYIHPKNDAIGNDSYLQQYIIHYIPIHTVTYDYARMC